MGCLILIIIIFGIPIGLVYFFFGYQPEFFALIGVFGLLAFFGAASVFFDSFGEKVSRKWAFKPDNYIRNLTNTDNPTKKVSKILSKHIQTIKNSIQKICNNYPFNQLSNLQLIKNEIVTDSHKSKEILESEMVLLNSFYDPQLFQNLTDHINSIEAEFVYEISTRHIKSILIDTGIQEYITKVKEQLENYRNYLNYAMQNTKSSLAIISSGITGEANVNNELSLYKDIWNIYSNVRFEVDGQSVETDNLIVCTKGVFSIEVKNYAPNGKYSIIVTKDGQWLKQLSDGKIQPMEKNVTAQVNRHLALKQRLIHSELKKKYGGNIPYILFQPIIVIANDTVRIQNDNELPILRSPQIYHHIIKQPDILTSEQLNDICSIIEANRLPVKEYPIITYSNSFPLVLQELKESEPILLKIREVIETEMKIALEEIYNLE